MDYVTFMSVRHKSKSLYCDKSPKVLGAKLPRTSGLLQESQKFVVKKYPRLNIFPCFPFDSLYHLAKRRANVSAGEPTLNTLFPPYVSTVRVSFHALSAKYFVLPARVISRCKATFDNQRITCLGFK